MAELPKKSNLEVNEAFYGLFARGFTYCKIKVFGDRQFRDGKRKEEAAAVVPKADLRRLQGSILEEIKVH
jgi:hypothetical protein